MKRVTLSLFLLLFTFFVFPQGSTDSTNIPVDDITGVIIYQEVVQVEGSKKELFNRGSEWLHEFFANPIYVTKTRDAASGVIKGIHQIEVIYTDEDGYKKIGGLVMYSFKIETKDGRFRYTVTDFLLKQKSRYPLEKWLETSDPNYNPQWAIYLNQINDYVRNEFAASLKESMKPQVVKEEEEW